MILVIQILTMMQMLSAYSAQDFIRRTDMGKNGFSVVNTVAGHMKIVVVVTKNHSSVLFVPKEITDRLL